MPASVVAAGIGAAGGIGSALLSKGKKTQYTQGLSPQAQGVSDQMAKYISGGLNRPTSYANVNPMQIQAMDMISRMFMGKGYEQPNYGMSAQGGGPSGMGMPGYPGYGQPRGTPRRTPAQTQRGQPYPSQRPQMMGGGRGNPYGPPQQPYMMPGNNGMLQSTPPPQGWQEQLNQQVQSYGPPQEVQSEFRGWQPGYTPPGMGMSSRPMTQQEMWNPNPPPFAGRPSQPMAPPFPMGNPWPPSAPPWNEQP